MRMDFNKINYFNSKVRRMKIGIPFIFRHKRRENIPFLAILPRLALLFLLFVVSLSSAQKSAKYIFLFIGDGMGDNQIYATELYKASLQGEKEYEPLSFSQFPAQTYMTTYSASSLITDSSAGATAMATGVKINNHVVAMDSTLQFSLETIGEKAKKSGYKVGILSSVTLDHATPASFYAHHESRNKYDEIAKQIAESDFDYFAGGGVANIGTLDSINSVISKLSESGYRYLTTKEEIENLKKGDTKIIAVNPATYSGREYHWEIDKPKENLSLAYMTKKGIELLDNEKGFFMMVEGGKIDWALHSNDLGSSIQETLAFDEAIQVAVDFYNNHKDETLIIVTADHETGGLTLGNNSGHDLNLNVLQYQKISAQEFERELSKLKESEQKIAFTELLNLVKENFGLGDKEKGLELSDIETKWLFDAYENEFIEEKKIDPDRDYLDSYSDKPFTLRVIHLLNEKAGIAWSTRGHTGAKVPVKAIGIGQEYFHSTIDNTTVYDIMIKVMNISNGQ